MTSLKQVLAQIPPAGRPLYKIWQGLPTGPLSEDELHSAILSATGHLEGDLAFASAIRHQLQAGEVVMVSRDAHGAVEYQRAATFPTWPPNGPGTEAFNRQLGEMQAAEHEARDRAAKVAYESSLENRQRSDVTALIDRRIVEVFGELIKGEDRATIERLRERLRKNKNAA